MKILLSWLRDYIDIDVTPNQIAKTLTLAGLEVDAIESLAPKCEGVIVCSVTDVKKHPEADKLCLATVFDGQNSQQIVCGAPNCRPGIKTALATLGATVFDDKGTPFKIKKSKIRGIESLGMLCGAPEIGIAGDTSGIIEFASHIKEGTDVASMYADTALEISLTPNLGHCSSLIGVARELSAATSQPVKYPKVSLAEKNTPTAKEISIAISNVTDCPRYACRIVEGITVGASPEWLQKRLEASGIRSINNVVDVTNYVLLELGHPLHAFDYNLLAGKKIIVRNAQEGETFVTLDGKERILEKRDLLICDAVKPVALAGVMGGGNSEVSEKTTSILLEAAYFAPTTVRRTSKRLGLATDASKRFERGTDPNVLAYVLDRAAMLIQQVAGGEILQGVVEAYSEQKFDKRRITCRLSRINKLLGTQLSASEVEEIFRKLEFVVTWDNLDSFDVLVPTYRNDVHGEIDLIEEVARLYGFDNIKKSTSLFQSSTIPHAPIYLFEKEVRARIIQEGLQEFLTCDLIGPTFLNVVQQAEHPSKAYVKVLNPTSVEQSILRTSLMPGLLQVVKYNWDHQNHNIAGFEIGRIHFKEDEHYKEQSVASFILSGKARPDHWGVKPVEYDFYDLKGMIENLFGEMRIPDVSFKSGNLSALHPGRQATIWAGKKEVGFFCEIHPDVQRRLDVPQRILFAEINLHELFTVKLPAERMRALPIYPGSERDWTVTLAEKMPISEIFDAIKAASIPLLETVSLVDIYRSDKLGADVKNATFRFAYRDKQKTIAQEKVDAEHARLIEKITNTIKSRAS